MKHYSEPGDYKQPRTGAAKFLASNWDHAVWYPSAKNMRNRTLKRNLDENVKSAMAPRIRTNVQVMFFDTDCGGVVSNIAYLRFIETARTHLAEELGLAIVEMAQKQTYPVVVRTEINYRRAAKLGDRLVIEGWLDCVERARFWCAFRIRRPEDNMLIAECRQMLALIEMPTGKLLRLPEHWKGYDKAESTEDRERESGTNPGGKSVQ